MKEKTYYGLMIATVMLVIIAVAYWTYEDMLEPVSCMTVPIEEQIEDAVRTVMLIGSLLTLSYFTMLYRGADSNGDK